MNSQLANPDLSAATANLPTARTGINFKLKEEDRNYWETWGERNKLAIEEMNAKIAANGVWGAKYRTFARNLG
jgi:post-segregation antitoxin (ccd killing protein)